MGDANGSIAGFSWIKNEVTIITKAFSDVLNKVSADPVCQNTESKRLLQTIPGASALTTAIDKVKNIATNAQSAGKDAKGLKDAFGSGKGIAGIVDGFKNITNNTNFDKFKNDSKAVIDGFKNLTNNETIS